MRRVLAAARRRSALTVGTAALLMLYTLGLGFALGVAVDRVWYDRARQAVLERYDRAVREWRQQRMDAERSGEAARGPQR